MKRRDVLTGGIGAALAALLGIDVEATQPQLTPEKVSDKLLASLRKFNAVITRQTVPSFERLTAALDDLAPALKDWQEEVWYTDSVGSDWTLPTITFCEPPKECAGLVWVWALDDVAMISEDHGWTWREVTEAELDEVLEGYGYERPC